MGLECVMREVDLVAFAAAHTGGAVVIDVREPEEYVSGHVPGARLMPLGRLAQHVAEMPPGQRVYVICASGNRSKVAADLLGRAGVDAVSVAGGTGGWQRAGKPINLGARP
jgi:rhodanese-related sulfurtransferase